MGGQAWRWARVGQGAGAGWTDQVDQAQRVTRVERVYCRDQAIRVAHVTEAAWCNAADLVKRVDSIERVVSIAPASQAERLDQEARISSVAWVPPADQAFCTNRRRYSVRVDCSDGPANSLHIFPE